MAEFVYNNFENTSTGHITFNLNYEYHPRVFFEDKYNTPFRSSSNNRLAIELRK